MEPDRLAKSGKARQGVDRALFWGYCVRAAISARTRDITRTVPCTITAHDLDRLLVDQDWCCAISGIPLEAPSGRPEAFSPSLDRIVPALGYVRGNVRIVCNLANFAMNKWGEEPLRRFVHAIKAGGT